ncbi:MAG: phosphocholine cytidylyltransferase family protein [Candidatus Cloacimonetes bacterium]|nr:phosphocholine cytidylyltransferase family protein [Candidatus Cloacimonadota bacterium]
MKAIILAAGVGRRIHPVTNGLPKSLLEFGGATLMHHQILSCQAHGIHDFVFVLGYEQERMRQHILEKVPSQRATFVFNPDFATTNTLYSLWLTRHTFDDDFIYFNADILFDPALLALLTGKWNHPRLLLEESRCAEEEVKMVVNSDNRVLRIGKQLDPESCAGEFIGIGLFTQNVLQNFARHLQSGVDEGESNNYFEWAVDRLADDTVIEAVPTQGLACIEIDFPEDYHRALQEVWPRLATRQGRCP